MSVPDRFDAVAGALQPQSKENYQKLLKEFESLLDSYWSFEIVPGMFKQSLAETDEFSFDYLKQDFGRVLTWEDTFAHLDKLNQEKSDENVQYKVFFLARHGQGYHNLANSKYGQKAWDDKWSHMTGDGEMVWAPDPDLTEEGINQAKDNAKAWGQQIANGVHLPTKWFASPFSRSLDTLITTWEKYVDLKKIQPLIKEDFRETTGVHLCDKRSPRAVIAEKYEPKGFQIEPGFAEEDIYFDENVRESIEHHSIRINRSFQYIFDNCPNDSVINVTSHSGSIRSQLLVLNHRPFAIGTGGMIPVFVKATRHAK